MLIRAAHAHDEIGPFLGASQNKSCWPHSPRGVRLLSVSLCPSRAQDYPQPQEGPKKPSVVVLGSYGFLAKETLLNFVDTVAAGGKASRKAVRAKALEFGPNAAFIRKAGIRSTCYTLTAASPVCWAAIPGALYVTVYTYMYICIHTFTCCLSCLTTQHCTI